MSNVLLGFNAWISIIWPPPSGFRGLVCIFLIPLPLPFREELLLGPIYCTTESFSRQVNVMVREDFVVNSPTPEMNQSRSAQRSINVQRSMFTTQVQELLVVQPDYGCLEMHMPLSE